MSCKATITLESDSPREAAELLRRVLSMTKSYDTRKERPE